ncbi:MAG: hypothetical protein IT385_12400 [Deltaproteobacteria bacterium]|nr:hypothetical protein [Deltaproteobacteria bacterium]
MPAHRLVALFAIITCVTVPLRAFAADDEEEEEDWYDLWWGDYEDEVVTKPTAPYPDGTLPPADGQTLRFTSGKLVLPLHGLEVTLPALGATTNDYYIIGGYWRLDPNGETHAVSHVIDEYVGGALRGGTSIQLGGFSDKTCTTMAAEFVVESPWSTASLELFGRTWAAQGGIQVRKSGARVPAVFLCTDLGKERLLVRRFFNADATLPDVAGTRAKLAALPALQAIVDAFVRRVPGTSRGIKDPMVTRQDKSLPASRTVTLSRVGLTLTLPDDERLWVVERTPKFEGQDVLFRGAPYVHPTDVTLLRMKNKSDCDAAFSDLARGAGRRWESPADIPPGWVSRVAFTQNDVRGFMLCRRTSAGALIVAVGARGATPTLRELHGLFGAIATAAGPEPALPTPSRPTPGPGPDPSPGPSRYEPEEVFFTGGVFLELPMSSRDTKALGLDEDRFPSFNTAGPGFGFSMVFGETGSWLGRFALWGSPAWGSLLMEGEETSSPRFGAQHWEAALEYGLNLGLDEGTALGLTLGWTGLSGPITKNSSLSASLVFASVADDVDDVSFTLRVTPVQLFAANERWLNSPFTAEAMLMVGGFAFGAELQYIQAPEAGDEDIPAEAWALILRLGIGAGER